MRLFSYWFLLLQVASSCSALVATGAAEPSSNRIFVGGLSNYCTDELLRDSFAKYGTVADISIIGLDAGGGSDTKRGRKPYAFVTFNSTESALDAISNHHSRDQNRKCEEEKLFQQVWQANPIDASKRKRSNNSRKKEGDQRDDIIRMCKQTNLILQVQSTHAHRLEDYINDVIRPEHAKDLNFRVEGRTFAGTRNMSLLFLSVSNPLELARRLSTDSILPRAVRKYYVVEKGATDTNLRQDFECESVVRKAFENGSAASKGVDEGASSSSYRVHTFPPSNQSRILSAIQRINDADRLDDEREEKLIINLNPRDFTDVLSIVQVYNYNGKGQEFKNNKGLVMAGVSPSFVPSEVNTASHDSDDAINRAFFKLQEAMSRYSREHGGFDSSLLFHGATAIDCGSSPGGWSKFLADDMNCKVVHSVDPGDLVVDLENVDHMQMKIQDAIPILKEKKSKIKVFVSDMCLHAMEEQLDFLLLAKKEGILEDDAFFVLTLKCNSGFSKNSFDRQVENVLEKLASKAKTRMLSTYHLFSNRSGERTVMGFIL